MPLTPFQKDVLGVLAVNRNPDSHVAGGIAINRADASPRFSSDIDLFHDKAATVVQAATADERTLLANGFRLTWVIRVDTGFWRAEVSRDDQTVTLDWATDSAFRFFPVQQDPEFGYCLHPADLATNKTLALAGRSEVRDYIDIIHLDETYLSLGALCWAASSKDPGLTPVTVLELTKRHGRYTEIDLNREKLARPLSLPELKQKWLAAVERAEALFPRLPAEDVGCLYLSADHTPVTPDPDSPAFASLRRHFGSLRGAWPTIVTA